MSVLSKCWLVHKFAAKPMSFARSLQGGVPHQHSRQSLCTQRGADPNSHLNEALAIIAGGRRERHELLVAAKQPPDCTVAVVKKRTCGAKDLMQPTVWLYSGRVLGRQHRLK
jgi:hypothetical protein